MALLSSGASGPGLTCVAVACGDVFIVGGEDKCSDDGSVFLHRFASKNSTIACIKFSPSGNHLGGCYDDKSVRVWMTADWKLKGEMVIPKRATALVFSNDDKFVLVADKAGDVNRYLLENLSLPATHLLGHFSMLLDLVLSPCDSHVITCDRDEKVRVSKYPNSYNIETFCLGHREFVTTLCLCDRYPQILISGSGDSTIRVWNWLEGKLLHTEVCSPPNGEQLHADLPAVVQVVCSNGDSPVVVAIVETFPEVFVYQLSGDGSLALHGSGNITLDMLPWSCSLDWSNHLWVCLPSEEEPLRCYKLSNTKFKKLCANEKPILTSLCKWEYFKDGIGREKLFSDLKKHVFDNMSDYLARKEERIREQEERKNIHKVSLQKQTENPFESQSNDSIATDSGLCAKSTLPTTAGPDSFEQVDLLTDDSPVKDNHNTHGTESLNDTTRPPVKKLKTGCN